MKQTSTRSSSGAKKGTRIPVAARTKALTERSGAYRRTSARPSMQENHIDATQRHAMIAQAAYFRAERRGFVNGGELDDWLEAEREVSRMLEG